MSRAHAPRVGALRVAAVRVAAVRVAATLAIIGWFVGGGAQSGGQEPLTPPSPAAGHPRLLLSNAERVATDRDTRSHDYHLVHQRIELRDIDWDSTAFTGRVSTVLVARTNLDSIILDAGAKLAISRVVSARGGTLLFAHVRDTLVVHFAHEVAMGDTVRFTIDYHARIDNGRGLSFLRPEGRPHRPQQIWSQGEAQDNHYWFPTYDFPNDKMTWELIATVPVQYTVVSNGRLVADTRGAAGMHTVHWSQETPSATYLVSLVVAPLARLSDHWRGVPVEYFVYHSDSARARRAFAVTPDMIEVYSRLTGIPYPWAKYAQATVADFFGGMENVSATTLVDWIPDSAAYHDRPWFQYILIPHELAHQWFGDYVTTENWANTWLNEGFAEFMPGQYWRTKLGVRAEQDYYLDEYRQYLEIERQRAMPLAALGSNNIYPKGALVLEMLQQYLGPQRFWDAVHYYLAHHALGTATTEDLRAAVLATSGENLAWFWNEWLYDAGLPTFDVTAAYDSTAHRVTLTVRQAQGDSSRVDSIDARGGYFTTPMVFTMPVAIRVGTAGKDVVAHAMLDARDQTIVIDSVPSRPTMVIFDDGNAVLKQLHFDQPTDWLATALRRDSNLWDRAWVIAQLAERTTDSTAASALATAAVHADYMRTREQAVSALAGFPARWSAPAVAAAAQDTAASVRAAAAGSLADADSTASRPRLRTLLHDPSYDVRAAALAALARVDVEDRTRLIAQGLSMPSYRDVIQDAALGAAIRARDTAVIDQIVVLARENRTAMIAVAVFARDGSEHALTLLNQALDDDAPSTRQSAVMALTRVLPPSLALSTLQSRVGSLTHADTRSAIQMAIHRLEEHTTPAQ